MTTYLIGFVAVLYGVVGCDYLMQGRVGFALTWYAYAVANVGLILAARQ
jgi:uncharacterized membrane protein YecN with MAPEG domain